MREAEVDWIEILRAGEQPAVACWAKLIAELRGAAAELAGSEHHARLTPDMAASLRVLVAFNDYLQASGVLQAEPRLASPLLRLIAALFDVSQGKTPALFRPAVPSGKS